MKKLLSLVLVLCMVAASCVMFSSCSKASTKDFEENPSEAVGDALSTTLGNFFEDGVGFADVLDKIKDKATIDVGFKLDDEQILDEPLEVNATIYADMKDMKAVVDAEVGFEGETYSARLYESPLDVAFSSKSILGSNKTLMFKTETFIDKFADSSLVEMSDMDDETVEAIVSIVEYLKEQGDKDSKELQEESREMLDEIYIKLNQTITEEKVETLDGKEVKCVVATYTFNNDTITAVVEYLFNEVVEDLPVLEDIMGVSADEAIDEFKEELDEIVIDATLKMAVAKKTNTLVNITLDGKVGDDNENDFGFSGAFEFSDTKIALVVDIPDVAKVTADVEKTVDGDEFKYDFSVKAETESVDVNVLNMTVTTDKDGAFDVSADVIDFINGDMDNRIKATLSGNIAADKDTASLSFNKVSVEAGDFEAEYKFKLSIAITADADLPEIPSDAEDIMDYSEEDWADLVEEISKSDLGKLFGGSSVAPDVDPVEY